MSSPENVPHLRVVRGEPTPEELSVLTALVAASGSGGDDAADPAPRRGGWSDPARAHRRPLYPGVNGWRGSAW